MREIKFRAFDVNEDMTYFSLNGITLRDGIQKEPFKSILKKEEGYTLMQYTGLKDSKGKEIYEKDLRIGYGQDNLYLQIIEFHNTKETSGRGWIGRNLAKINTIEYKVSNNIIISEKIDRFSYFGLPSRGDVIGNIYENPELLDV